MSNHVTAPESNDDDRDPPTKEEFEAHDAWELGPDKAYTLTVHDDHGLWFTSPAGAVVMHLSPRGAATLLHRLREIELNHVTSPWGPDRFASVKAFAKHMLAKNRLLLRPIPDLIEADEIATRMVLFREGCWQVELVVGRPNAVLLPHCHDHVESLHLVIGDSGGSAEVDGRTLRWRGHRGPLSANLVHVPKGARHSGVGGSHGSAFIAFEKWDGEPSFVRHDWRDA